ncbi:hypothetical protein N7478_002420 [Penicillium angulare]|uniref:uncharacterized protein n=1 Tax=Penicillium angulare TaxID=116970 RepID=UPI0025413317|nr:uncharacterized protein N7478_002420 [Penicillium angulare]KAJ5286734.1 hypothetical protein N7478_002420 [Penicillium angulare]
MSDESNGPTHEHEGFFERMLHPHKKDENEEKEPEHEYEHDAKDLNSSKKKESEMDKFKDYIHEDEEIEQEGGTYGNLM